ncbi:hypothetical protein KJ885_02290 [Patescibacteria group bacterium]|nr:hypothetical protein [Patescibacteria group bacterium]
MKTPYIGITDFMDSDEVMRALYMLSRVADGLNRKLMIGVMMSRKTLNDIPTKWARAFPHKDHIRWIFFQPEEMQLNTLHYADYDGIEVAKNLEKAVSYGGQNLHALQLDMIWPEATVIREFRTKHPHIQIIIQANSVALEQVENNPELLIAKLKEYGDAIDYVLLDKSMGRGLGMNANALLPFARAVANNLPKLGIAAAGGLGPDTLHLVEPLVKEFPDISIDAQGKLRPSGSALDPIDWNMAKQYLRRALEMFKKYKQ